MQNIKSFTTFINENATSSNPYGELFVKLLWVRDQAHIFHWQTKSYAKHIAFGDFYEEYIDSVDDLAENIMSKMGVPILGNANIQLLDFSEDYMITYLDDVTNIFENQIKNVVPSEGNNGIYNLIDDVLTLVGKIRYLVTLK
jgi:DNA-binding ferritin-like protein